MTASERRAGSGLGGIMVCVLVFSGLSSSLHEYHFVNKSMSWIQAKRYCDKMFTTLASIHSSQDMLRVKEAVGSSFQGKVWIGLSDRRPKWNWSMSNRSFYAAGEYNFSRWHPGEPNDIQRRGRLCVGVKEGTWYDLSCFIEHPSICYDKNSTNSSMGFVLVNQTATWWQAAEYCKTNHTDLASVRNERENSEIQRLVGDERLVWIGLFRYTWRQWAGANSKFENWLSGHPKEPAHCCVTSLFAAPVAGEWVEERCGTELPFVCHQTLKPPPVTPEKKMTFKIKISTPESIDLNHPAVTRALLDQIQEKMGAMGITAGFRVSWIKKSDQKIFIKEKKKEV